MTDKNILIDVPMPIVTPRLIIRPPQPGDGKVMHAAKMENFRELSKWMPWAKQDETVEETESMIRESYAKFIKREDMMLLGFHRETGDFVISTGLHRINWDIRSFEIGAWGNKKYYGYATETVNALTRYAFGALNARRVETKHAEGNKLSIAVPKRLGFVYEGKNDFATLLPNGDVVAKHTYARFDIKNLPDLEVTWN